MTLICPHCNKEYSSQSSRSNHIKKYHKSKLTETPPTHFLPPPETHQIPPKNTCSLCKIIFSRKDSLTRHINKNRCKIPILETPSLEKLETSEILEIKKENLEMKAEIDNLKNLLQKSLKIHPRTLNKINNQLNNTNNITINNNSINIVQLGHEDLSEILSDNQKLRILNRQAMSINDLVTLIHTSDKFIQFKNVYITNLRSSFGYKYDEQSKKFLAISKNELLDDILDARMYDIEKFYSDMQYKMEPDRAKKIKHFIEKMTAKPEMKNLKREEIQLILYNNKESIMSITGKNIKESLLCDKKKE
jgi:uncharacterized C2H2 Zn-finger protein